MSLAQPHHIDWFEGVQSFEELNQRLARVCADLDDTLVSITSQALGMAGALVEHGVLVGSQTSPTAKTIDPGTINQVLISQGSSTDPIFSDFTESQLVLIDVTTNNVTSTKHGFAPKSPGDATKFLNGAATPAFALVKDSDLSTSDIVTNDVTTAKHGFVPKAPNDTTKFLRGDATWAVPTSSGSGGLIGIQVITATGAGTYTPTTGTGSVVIELQGGGGGGGGVSSPTGTASSLAAGGSGGGYLRVRLTTAFSGAGYVVGAKGTGGTAGNNNGNAGSDTTFTATGGGGTVYTAAKGNGGTGSASQGGNVGFSTTGITAGGTVTNGDVKIPGGQTTIAFGIAAGQAQGGMGGDSFMGKGAHGTIINAANTSVAGTNGSGYGAGGSGAIAGGTGVARAGGDGTDGIIIIWEFAS